MAADLEIFKRLHLCSLMCNDRVKRRNKTFSTTDEFMAVTAVALWFDAI